MARHGLRWTVRPPDEDDREPRPKRGRATIARFWLSDWSLTALLVLLVFDTFVLGPIMQFRQVPRALQPVVYSLLVVAAIPIALRSRWPRVVTLVLGALAAAGIVARWWSHLHPGVAPERADTITGLAFCIVLAVVVLAQAYAPGAINLRRIQGAIAAYLLLALVWALAYRMVALADPTAFTFNAAELHPQTLTARLMYFSVMTLTTVGYGDITPLNPFARSLAALEGVFGALFPTLTIARLVSMHISQREQRRE